MFYMYAVGILCSYPNIRLENVGTKKKEEESV
jgi:hypothetical protein